MKKPFQLALLCLSVFAPGPRVAQAQSLPAGTGSVPNVGFRIPRLAGSLSYALNASELISTGFYNTGTAFTTDFDGDLAYFSSSLSHPTNIVYAGGVLLANSGQPTTTYQDLSVSQVLKTKNWNFEIQDGVSYLPESPVGGLSGIPGVGDLGVDPVPIGPTSGIGILTDYGPRVSNTVSGSAERLITPHISAEINGYDSIQRFIGDNAYQAINSDSEGGSAGVSYHFSSLTALTVSYNYSTFSYPGTSASFSAQGATIDYSRQWTRKFSTDAYIGPQILQSTGPGSYPSSTQISGGAGLAYSGKFAFYTLTYARGANNGSGVIPGSFSDNVSGAIHRQIRRVWNVSGFLGYTRTSSLPVFESYTFDSDAESAGGQVSRALGRRFAGYASYTFERQTASGNAAALNAFHGLYQIFGIGISYSPGVISLNK